MTKPTNNEDRLSRIESICRSVAQEVENLLSRHIIEIENDAAQVADPDSDKPVKAKVSYAVEWPAGEESPAVDIDIKWTVSKKDSSEVLCDWRQTKIRGVE